MAIRGGPDIIEDGLVLHLDAADRNSYPVNPELVTNSNLLTLGDGNFETCLRSSTSTIGLDIGPIVSGKTYQIIWNVSARRGTISATFRTGFTVISGSTNANFGTGMKHHVFTSNQTGTLRFYGDGNGCDFDVDYASLREYPSSNSISDLVNNNNGVLTNGPVFTPENAGSIRFDGSNDRIVGPSSLSSFNNSQMTIGIWTKPDSVTQKTTLLSKWGRSTLGNFSWLLFLNWWTDGNLYFLVGNPSGSSYSQHYIPHLLSTSNYSNFVITYSSGDVKMYRNGNLISSSTSSYTTLKSVSTPIGIGHDYDTGTGDNPYRHYDGSIASVSMHNHALSASEVQQNYNATKGRFGL